MYVCLSLPILLHSKSWRLEPVVKICAVTVQKKKKKRIQGAPSPCRCSGTFGGGARDSRSVARRVRSKWRAQLVNKVAEGLTSTHAGIERSPGGARHSSEQLWGERGERTAAPVVCRAFVPREAEAGHDESRGRRKMECVYKSVTASACVLSTAVHSGSFGERTQARARARAA